MLAFTVLLFLTPSLALARPSRSASAQLNSIPIVFRVNPPNPSLATTASPSELGQLDAPNFGQSCEFQDAYKTCGDFFHLATGVDHALFCSPAGVCAGTGAACGGNESCRAELECNTISHRCVPRGSFVISPMSAKQEQRRKAASKACPEGSEACSAGSGGFECIHTNDEVEECGGCIGFGGRNCARLALAVGSSCRNGACVIHACSTGYTPSQFGTECEEERLE